jgi:hypothetical protein
MGTTVAGKVATMALQAAWDTANPPMTKPIWNPPVKPEPLVGTQR